MGRENTYGTVVHFTKRNWNLDCMYDLASQKGFLITQPPETKLDGESQKNIYGPRSPLYGTDMTDENGYAERYRCKCGSFMGTRFKGEICPQCNTEVKFEDTDIDITGWIPTGEHSIINPYFYKRLTATIGKKRLNEIINVKKKVGRDGHSESLNHISNLAQEKSDHPFVGIGLREFYSRYKEIMEWFKNKYKSKQDSIDELLKDADSLFVRFIPVYSTKLRPQSMTSSAFYFTKMDKELNPLVNLCIKVREGECSEMEIDKLLNAIQGRVNNIWELNMAAIKGKKGYIRGMILGGALNNTARNVIVPDPTLRVNECAVSYHTFLELGKFTILHYIMKYDGCTLGEAYRQWKDATLQFSPKVYEIMNLIVKKENPYIVVDRNPTLNFTSTSRLKVKFVKDDFADKTLGIPLGILSGLNADFDGDVINLIMLSERELIKLFDIFSPVFNIISRDSGLLNEQFALNKDTLIDLYYWATNDLEDKEDVPEETMSMLREKMLK